MSIMSGKKLQIPSGVTPAVKIPIDRKPTLLPRPSSSSIGNDSITPSTPDPQYMEKKKNEIVQEMLIKIKPFVGQSGLLQPDANFTAFAALMSSESQYLQRVLLLTILISSTAGVHLASDDEAKATALLASARIGRCTPLMTVLHSWLQESIKNSNPLVGKIIELFGRLPLTIEQLLELKIGKYIKKIAQSEISGMSEQTITQAKALVESWSKLAKAEDESKKGSSTTSHHSITEKEREREKKSTDGTTHSKNHGSNNHNHSHSHSHGNGNSGNDLAKQVAIPVSSMKNMNNGSASSSSNSIVSMENIMDPLLFNNEQQQSSSSTMMYKGRSAMVLQRAGSIGSTNANITTAATINTALPAMTAFSGNGSGNGSSSNVISRPISADDIHKAKKRQHYLGKKLLPESIDINNTTTNITTTDNNVVSSSRESSSTVAAAATTSITAASASAADAANNALRPGPLKQVIIDNEDGNDNGNGNSNGDSSSSNDSNANNTKIRENGIDKRRVSFPPNDKLCQVYYIEPEYSRHSFTSVNYQHADKQEASYAFKRLRTVMEPEIEWKTPKGKSFLNNNSFIELNRLPNLEVVTVNSEEALIQEKRERTSLSAIYFDNNQIPPSPSESLLCTYNNSLSFNGGGSSSNSSNNNSNSNGVVETVKIPINYDQGNYSKIIIGQKQQSIKPPIMTSNGINSNNINLPFIPPSVLDPNIINSLINSPAIQELIKSKNVQVPGMLPPIMPLPFPPLQSMPPAHFMPTQMPMQMNANNPNYRTAPCKFYQAGKRHSCKRGDSCPFAHLDHNHNVNK